MQLSKLISGLQILQKYFNNPEGYHIGAEHDVIYVFQTDNPVTNTDIIQLVELGFFQQDADWGDDDEFEPKHYDPDESWAAYT